MLQGCEEPSNSYATASRDSVRNEDEPRRARTAPKGLLFRLLQYGVKLPRLV
jgi:hypothetical protein